MIPQPMVPTRHLPTCDGKKTAKHYVNMAPLWDHLISLMNLIDDGIREASLKLLERRQQNLQIYTATEDVQDPEFFSMLKKKLHIDKTFKQNIWYKFVYNEYTKEGVIIYIHNTPRTKIVKKCNDMKCNFKAWVSSTSTEIDEQYAYCCEATARNIQEIFQLNLQVQRFLDISSISGAVRLEDYLNVRP